MDIERHIRLGVLDQDHLANLLLGEAEYAEEIGQHVEEIRRRVVQLIEAGVVDLYTHPEGQEPIRVLDRATAVAIASDARNWSWQSESGHAQLYFLSPAKLADGSLAYGLK